MCAHQQVAQSSLPGADPYCEGVCDKERPGRAERQCPPQNVAIVEIIRALKPHGDRGPFGKSQTLKSERLRQPAASRPLLAVRSV